MISLPNSQSVLVSRSFYSVFCQVYHIRLAKFIGPDMFKHNELPGLFNNCCILPNKLLITFDICNFVCRMTVLDLHLLFLKREHTLIIYHVAHILGTCCVVTPANVVIIVLWDQCSYEEMKVGELWGIGRGRTIAWESKGYNTHW